MTLVKRDYRLGDPYSEMDGFFNRSFWNSDFWPGVLSRSNVQGAGRGFPVNVYEKDDAYSLVAEIPGVKREDIDLKLENAVLTITVKRSVGEGEDAKEYSATRSITVGDDVKSEGVTAKLENGVLAVALPKGEERKPKSISVD